MSLTIEPQTSDDFRRIVNNLAVLYVNNGYEPSQIAKVQKQFLAAIQAFEKDAENPRRVYDFLEALHVIGKNATREGARQTQSITNTIRRLEKERDRLRVGTMLGLSNFMTFARFSFSEMYHRRGMALAETYVKEFLLTRDENFEGFADRDFPPIADDVLDRYVQSISEQTHRYGDALDETEIPVFATHIVALIQEYAASPRRASDMIQCIRGFRALIDDADQVMSDFKRDKETILRPLDDKIRALDLERSKTGSSRTYSAKVLGAFKGLLRERSDPSIYQRWRDALYRDLY